MKFYSLKDKRPKGGQTVLVKYVDAWDDKNYFDYYVMCYLENATDGYCFEEAGGEQYWQLHEDAVVGWMPIEELDEIEVQND